MKLIRMFRGRGATSVVLATCTLLAGCSWGRNATPSAKAGGETATVPGRLVTPSNSASGGWVVVADGRRFPVDASGRFTVRIRRDTVVAVTATRTGGRQGGLAAVITGASDTLRLDSASTAAALVFLDPLLSTADGARAGSVLEVARKDPAVTRLAGAVADALRHGQSTTGPAVTSAYGSALASVVHTLDAPTPTAGGTSAPPPVAATTTAPSTTTTTSSMTMAGGSGVDGHTARRSDATLVGSATSCPSPVPIAPTYDQTNLSFGPSCSLSLDASGPATIVGGARQPAAAWLWTVSSLTPGDAPSTAGATGTVGAPTSATLATAATSPCAVYAGEDKDTLVGLVLPTPGAFDWLAPWTRTALSNAVSQSLGHSLASSYPDRVSAVATTYPPDHGLLLYRAYSGGGELNPSAGNGCIAGRQDAGAASDASAAARQGTPDGPTLSNAALALNILTMGLDAVSPLVDPADEAFAQRHACVANALSSTYGDVRQDLNQQGNLPSSAGFFTAAVDQAAASMFTRLSACAADLAKGWAAARWSTLLQGDLETRITEGAAFFTHGSRLVSLSRFLQATNPVESAFVPFGGDQTSTAPAGSGTTTTTSTPALPPTGAGGGASWSAPTVIDPYADQIHPLKAVSCPTETFCVAVDYGGYAVTFDGTQWSAPVRVAKVDEGQLTAVSCGSPTFCVALDVFGVTYVFDGSAWGGPNTQTDQRVAVGFKALSCPVASWCVSVNRYGQSFFFDGTTWTRPAFTYLSGVNIAVSCTAAQACVATDNNGHSAILGPGGWVQGPAIGTTAVYAVSCASPSSCLASAGAQSLLFDGVQWHAPLTVGTSLLTALSCPTATFCLGVGGASTGQMTAAYVFDGQAWSPASGAELGDAVAASCASASFCVAVSRAQASVYRP